MTSTVTIPNRVDRGKERRSWWVDQLASQGAVVAFVLWIAFLVIATPAFATPDNLMVVSRQAAIYAIVAIGITMVMLLGELDISFGSALSIGGVVGTMILIGGHGLFASLGAALAVGIAFGLVNAFLITVLKIPSVVATLATLGAGEGVAQLITRGTSLYGPELAEVSFLTRGDILGIPILVIIAVVGYVIAWVVLTKTRAGAHLYAAGDNKNAAFRAGINVTRIRVVVFVTASALAALAGVLMAVRLGRATGDMGVDTLFPVLTAVILGGVSIEGGRGRIFNTLIASVFLASITNGLILLGIDASTQMIIQGAVLAAAVSLDRLRK